MYSLPYFKEKDPEVIKAFMRQNSFAMLIGSNDGFPVATQVPLLIEEREGKLVLLGHIMRNTDHHKALEVNPTVLCVFTGAHAYVSASWYTAPQNASTWNYMSVHARGQVQFLGHEALLSILERTTRHYENNDNSPASFHHLPEEYVQRLSTAVVGLEIEVTALDTVFKLSQNRDQVSYENIIVQLEKGDAAAKGIAAEMRQRQQSLFNPL
jgi:transcriptional regulator